MLYTLELLWPYEPQNTISNTETAKTYESTGSVSTVMNIFLERSDIYRGPKYKGNRLHISVLPSTICAHLRQRPGVCLIIPGLQRTSCMLFYFTHHEKQLLQKATSGSLMRVGPMCTPFNHPITMLIVTSLENVTMIFWCWNKICTCTYIIFSKKNKKH